MDLITQKRLLMEVGPGTPMNACFKRFWLPIALTTDVADNDGDPMRVRALGEDFVLFRDSEGRLGLLDELCTHRSASLCLGRNEEGGLRCLYHGWKYAVDGTILETPNVRDPRFKERVRQPAYAVREAGGVVWGYFGPQDKEPPFQHYPFFDLPGENVVVELVVCSANYTRLVEGLIDTTHTGSLHQDALRQLAAGEGPAPSFGGTPRVASAGVLAQDLAPDIEVQETDFGFRYAAVSRHRQADGSVRHRARVTSFKHPTSILIQSGHLAQMVLPVDDDRSYLFMAFWDPTRNIRDGEARQEILTYYGIDDIAKNVYGAGREFHDLPDRPNKSNNWLQDRAAMKNGSFTGLYRFIPEDFAVSASMGRVERFPVEHLVPADLAIARFRRQMIDNVQRVQKGEDPRGFDPEEQPRPAQYDVAEGEDWRDHYTRVAD
ncbi:Rieske 2Fe-2S domain-containing protein [Nonomuraea wenchangensis]|uniref:Rieske 2Fe-2S domain-containing protein n=1 Tax=Nonomuraea wenchangensis TaxID=568860 RepID=UPI00384C8356